MEHIEGDGFYRFFKAEEGFKVYLEPYKLNSDEVFIKWEVTKGNVTLSDVYDSGVSFIMPGEEVQVDPVINLRRKPTCLRVG